MTHRDRVLCALSHEEADRVPRDLGGNVCTLTEGAYDRLSEHLGIDEPEKVVGPFFTVHVPDERILERLGVDLRRVFLQGRPVEISSDGTFTDDWGLGRRVVEQKEGRYAEVVERPLRNATEHDIERHDWPDAHAAFRVEGLRERAAYVRNETDYALAAASCCAGPFELSWFVRGLEEFLMDMVLNRRFADRLVEKVCDVEKGFYDAYLGAVGDYIDILELTDDYGMQTGPIMSPTLYRDAILPHYIGLIEFIRERTGARICHHSCGSVTDILDNLIDVGVDIINPLQPSPLGMGDPAALKKRFGGRICFHGGIDEQYALPHGTPAEVRGEVRKRIAGFAPGGGYILASAHNIQADTPPENVIAMFDAAEEFGGYPISA